MAAGQPFWREETFILSTDLLLSNIQWADCHKQIKLDNIISNFSSSVAWVVFNLFARKGKAHEEEWYREVTAISGC